MTHKHQWDEGRYVWYCNGCTSIKDKLTGDILDISNKDSYATVEQVREFLINE